jgi:hypothetical protein
MADENINIEITDNEPLVINIEDSQPIEINFSDVLPPTALRDLVDVDTYSVSDANKILKISSDGTRTSWETDQSGTDEKVKFDSEDPVAGYIIDKFTAGSGISLTEGTGDGENVLIISNTDKGSDVDLSGKENVGVAASLDAQHLLDFTHSDIVHINRSSLDLVSGTNTGDQDLSGLVPYTGATGNVNLNNKSLSTRGFVYSKIKSNTIKNDGAVSGGVTIEDGAMKFDGVDG